MVETDDGLAVDGGHNITQLHAHRPLPHRPLRRRSVTCTEGRRHVRVRHVTRVDDHRTGLSARKAEAVGAAGGEGEDVLVCGRGGGCGVKDTAHDEHRLQKKRSGVMARRGAEECG